MRGGRSSLNAFTARHIGKIVGGMAENRSRTKIEKRRHVRNTRAAEWKRHRPKRSHVSKNGAAIRMSDTHPLLFKMSIVWHSLRFFLFIQLFVVGRQLFVDHVPTSALVPFLLNRLVFDEFGKYYVSVAIVWNLFKHAWKITK